MTDVNSQSKTPARKFSYYYAKSILPFLNLAHFSINFLRSFLLIFGFGFLFHYGAMFLPHTFGYNEVMDFHNHIQKLAFINYPFLNEIQRPAIWGEGIPDIILIACIFILVIIIKQILYMIGRYAKYIILKITFDQLDAAAISSKKPEELKELESTLSEAINDESDSKLGKRGRQEMLDLYREIRVKLEDMKTDLTFLSIDVVDSTGMKENEESVTIEVDFSQYNKLVDSVFKRNGCLKAAWTPDGVMCCFPTADQAVNAAQEILDKMVHFNLHEKSIRRDFSLRCGTNSGKVPFDENMPLETLCDHVIDVAGHFQKYGLTDLVCISKNTYDRLSNPTSFRSAAKSVDGIDMYIQDIDSSQEVQGSVKTPVSKSEITASANLSAASK